MISIIEDDKVWSDKYKIFQTEIECPTCNLKFIPTIPIAIKGYRGLMLSNHGCGINMPFRVVPVGEEELAIWEGLRPNEDK